MHIAGSTRISTRGTPTACGLMGVVLGQMLGLGAIALAAHEAHGQACSFEQEIIEFGGPGLSKTAPAAIFDDGDGPALYTVATFEEVICACDSHLLRFDGERWISVGAFAAPTSTTGPVLDMQVFDLGDGPALYIGGRFDRAGGVAARNIVRYDRDGFSSLGIGIGSPGGSDGSVHSLERFDDGSGPALIAGGTFQDAGGVAVNNVARWDGSGWSALGPGVGFTSTTVTDLTVFDDGSGPAIFAAGRIRLSARDWLAARFDGSRWTLVGPPNSRQFQRAEAIEVFDDSTGPAVYVGGNFTQVGSGGDASFIARLEDNDWVGIGDGLDGVVTDLVSAEQPEDGMYVAGEFATASSGGAALNGVALWDGERLEPLAAGLDAGVEQVIVGDIGAGTQLIALGDFESEAQEGGIATPGIARWDGAAWAPLATPAPSEVRALAVIDGAAGPEVYVGGTFTATPFGPAQGIARFADGRFEPLGTAWSGGVNAIEAFDDGSSHATYAAGAAGTINLVGRWDGSRWLPVGDAFDAPVRALRSFEDTTGPALFAGGEFGRVGSAPASAVARFDGATWSAVPGLTGTVQALAVFDDGFGGALYAGGTLTDIDGMGPGAVARWDGVSWTRVAVDGAPAFAGSVLDLGVARIAGDDVLVAGGAFARIGTVAAENIAVWDGVSWSSIGSGLPGRVTALAPFIEEGLPLAAAYEIPAIGRSTSSVQTWDGRQWRERTGSDGPVLAMARLESPTELSTYYGGGFVDTGSIASATLGRLVCGTCEADLDGDGMLTFFDFLVFQSLFDQRDPRADLDGDGSFTILDFLVFQTFFDDGCP